MKKIIPPNIIVFNCFIQELKKGFYKDNDKNRKLGRVGLPYGKSTLEKEIKDLNIEIANLEQELINFEEDKNSWIEVLNTRTENTEEYEYAKNKINDLIDKIENYKDKIKNKYNLRKEYKEKILEIKNTKVSKETEYLTKKELEYKYGGKFGKEEYPRTFTAGEQNHNDLD